MWRMALFLLPVASWATDYYECISPDGSKSYQVEKCDKSHEQRHIRDDKAPTTHRVDNSNQPMTTQVTRSGLNYYGTGYINGKAYRMMVDTGASFVSISRDQALSAGVPLRGRPMKMQTANGIVSGVLTTAKSVSFAGHEIKNVPVVVQTGGRPFPGVLLGMSFLSHFDLNMSGKVMSMTKR
jgi:clan AA aspartic protease (TIGR02281 family)